MFEHMGFEKIAFEEVPLNLDLVLMGEEWRDDYEKEWLKYFNGEEADLYPGYVSYAAARSVGDGWLELSWFPNLTDRYHEIPIFLPKSEFVACVEMPQHDEDPHIFVSSEWLKELHERPLAAFAIVDGIGIKQLLQRGALHARQLEALRARIDEIADRHPDLAFVSFADSLLVKQVWSVGHVGSAIKYTYKPESLLPVISELFGAFEGALGTKAYAVLTQGLNAFADENAVHLSKRTNHVALNTLGLPFAQLMGIEGAARNLIRQGSMAPADIYFDSTFFHSLKWKHEFDKASVPLHLYPSPMTKGAAKFAAMGLNEVLPNLA